jgi:hypothetical protein
MDQDVHKSHKVGHIHHTTVASLPFNALPLWRKTAGRSEFA